MDLAIHAGEFQRANLAEILPFEDHLRALPTGGAVRGLLLNGLLQTTERACGKRARNKPYTPFKDYPLAEFVNLARDCHMYAFPRGTFKQALYTFGLDVFPVLAQTMIGRTVFSLAPHNWGQTLELALKSDALLNCKPGTARLVEQSERRAVVALRNVWSFADCYHVGMFTGGMTMFGERGSVSLRRHATCDVDICLDW